MKNFTASTIINYSPRKSRLVLDAIRGKNIEQALDILIHSNKPKSIKVYKLLISAVSNLKVTKDSYSQILIATICAEEAQKYYRVVPRARGSAAKIRRRYSRIKVLLEPKFDNIKI